MDYSIESAPLEKLQCDCIIVGVYQDQQLSPTATALNNRLKGLSTKLSAVATSAEKMAKPC